MDPTLNEKGFTLVEVMITILIFTAGMIGAGNLFLKTKLIDYNNSSLDQANRMLSELTEEINLTLIEDLPNLDAAAPNTSGLLKTSIRDNFNDNTYLAGQSNNGIRLYRVVYAQTPNLKRVLLAAAWIPKGETVPQVIFRRAMKPVANDT